MFPRGLGLLELLFSPHPGRSDAFVARAHAMFHSRRPEGTGGSAHCFWKAARDGYLSHSRSAKEQDRWAPQTQRSSTPLQG